MPSYEQEWRYTERYGDVVVRVSVVGDNDVADKLRDDLVELLVGTYDSVQQEAEGEVDAEDFISQEEADLIVKAAARVHRS